MARSLFAGRPGDSVASYFNIGARQVYALPADVNGAATDVTLTVWDEPDGEQLTDLLAADGTTEITEVVVPAGTGQIPEFYGPDGVFISVYLKDSDGDFQRLDARPDAFADQVGLDADRAEDAAAQAETVGIRAIADRIVSPRMPMVAYAPELTEIVLVDSTDRPWNANPTIVQFDGKTWVFHDGNDDGDEGADGSIIWGLTTNDGFDTVSAQFNPFRDATLCNNPVTGASGFNPDTAEWQPCGTVHRGKLMEFWRGHSSYVSILESGVGEKWTNYQVEWKGREMRLSSTLTNTPSGGWARYAEFDGENDWIAFPASDPIVLSDGVLALPMTLESQTVDPLAPPTAPPFWKLKKANVVAYLSADGTTWTVSEPIPPQAGYGNYAAWEPGPVELADGSVGIYSRNNKTAVPNNETLLLAVSRNRYAFSVPQPVDLLVPVSRQSTKQVSNTRWLMVHCDYPHNDTSSPEAFAASGRINATLFVSRYPGGRKAGRDGRSGEDLTPGVGVSGTSANQSYPQFCVHNDKIYVVYTEDDEAGRSLRLSILDSVPDDDDKAYVHPRRYSEFVGGSPIRVPGPPESLLFHGQQRATAAAAPTASTDRTLLAVIRPAAITGKVLWDQRPSDGSSNPAILRSDGVSLAAVTLTHGVTLTADVPSIIAATIEAATGKIRFSVFVENVLHQVDAYAKAITVTGTPANNDTVVVAGTTFTWKTSPVAGTDVQIGGSADASALNLSTKLAANGFKAGFGATGTGRLFVAKNDQTTFTVTYSGTAAATTNLPVSGVAPRFGSKIPTSSTLAGYLGDLYFGGIWRSALTDANILSIYHQWNVALGLPGIAGTQTAPVAADIELAGDSTTTDFPDIDDPTATVTVGTETINGEEHEILTIAGEASAAVEQPYETTTNSVCFEIPEEPVDSERYTVGTIGSDDDPVLIQFRAGLGGTLFIGDEGSTVDFADITQWNVVEITVSPGWVHVGGHAVPFAGPPKFALGCRPVEGHATPDNIIKFDLTRSSVADGRGSVQAPLRDDLAGTVTGDRVFEGDVEFTSNVTLEDEVTFNGDVNLATPAQVRTELGLGASAVLGTYWRRVQTGKGAITPSSGSPIGVHEGSAASPTGTNGGQSIFYIDPADWPTGAKLRVRTTVTVNDTAPTSTFVAGLYPISGASSGVAGPSGPFGTVVSGSTATVAAPAIGTRTTAVSTEFDVPAAGHYALGIAFTPAVVTNSAPTVRVTLDVKF